ncbi:uncharacterized protein PHACADRAFT_185395 [Phanerochaete carnosa HHB-10118-sp]|uniref:Uncharacterized protein n=1 Tax=Phanerochaete carnosa (strain HHB-10118-sp) TaxID=650164 RepID=K5VSK4_PHACS|nr:uncharacterized protein PHACADRAFT_185395 [Phanerochaete carnosa HHB-10118-sp]EKM54473.1 hypothetical protein PHACADRAFT_185395 [Phanerochaete carnosa HHB-10118-sp]
MWAGTARRSVNSVSDTSVVFTVVDSTGAHAQSSSFTVESGPDNSCVLVVSPYDFTQQGMGYGVTGVSSLPRPMGGRISISPRSTYAVLAAIASQSIVSESSPSGDPVPSGVIVAGVVAGVAAIALACFGVAHCRTYGRTARLYAPAPVELVPSSGPQYASVIDGWRTEEAGDSDEQTLGSLSRTSTIVSLRRDAMTPWRP